jgi:short-subunit dehydrogenase
LRWRLLFRMQQLATQTVVITGASAGVGRAVAHRFARSGARLGLIARDADALAEVKAEAEKLGADDVITAPADVSDADAVFAAAETFERKLGPITVWVNDAMVTVFSLVWELKPDEFRRVTQVTYLGCVNGTMAALRYMRPRDKGSIIQVGSALAYRGIPLQSAYCGAKHAIRGFTSSLQSELIHDRSNVNVTIVELPAVNTPQFDWARTHLSRQPRPVPPVVQPEVIARAIHYAAQHPRREYWIGWSTAKVVLGNMILPGFLDRYLAKVAYKGQETALLVSRDRRDNLMDPVTDLHRTHGSFGAEASDRALLVDGRVGRLLPVVGGSALLLLLGLLLGRRLQRT